MWHTEFFKANLYIRISILSQNTIKLLVYRFRTGWSMIYFTESTSDHYFEIIQRSITFMGSFMNSSMAFLHEILIRKMIQILLE